MSIDDQNLTRTEGMPNGQAIRMQKDSKPDPDNNRNSDKDSKKERGFEKLTEEVGNALSEAQTGVENHADEPGHHHHRTTGLKIFDVFLYPFLTNFAVFGISVVATYLTSHGDKSGGKIGKFFYNRGEWMTKQMTKKLHWNQGTADMAKMVFFSFADGSLIAPMVKLLEDRREKIARWIDNRLGTKPDDPNAYSEEPKQSWWSVLAGRLATVSIVVPTAVALDKTGLNDKLFSNPGKKTGEWIAKKPQLAKVFGKNTDIPGLFKTVFFEFFYTSVCTAGLYFSSRFLAAFRKPKHQHDERLDTATAPSSKYASSSARDGNSEINIGEGKFASTVGKKSIAPQEKNGSMVERYERDQAATAQTNAAIT